MARSSSSAHWSPADALAWRPSREQKQQLQPRHRGGCACVHLRHLRKTGGQSLVQFFTNLGFERLPMFIPGKVVPGCGHRAPGCGPRPPSLRAMNDAFGAAQELLANNRSFFDAHQAGRLTLMEYHSPWAQHGPAFLKHLQPRLAALRAAYASANCSFLVLTVVRHPVSHYVSDYFYFEQQLSRASPRRATQQRLQAGSSRAIGKAAVKAFLSRLPRLPSVHEVDTTLQARARMHAEMQMVRLACIEAKACYDRKAPTSPGLPSDPASAPTRRNVEPPYLAPPVASVRAALRVYDVVGVTEFLGAMQAEVCRRLGWQDKQCPDAVEKNAANPVVLLKHTGIGEVDAPLTIDDAKRLAQPGQPLHAVLLALAPLTACVHAAALQSWRSGVAASGGTVSNFTCVRR